MNNSNDLTKTILETIGSNNVKSLESDNNFISSSNDYNFNFFDYLKSITWYTWIILILILSFLGFNIFVYLAKGTQGITDFFSPIINYILNLFGMVGIQLVDNTAEGTKTVVNTTANVVNTGLSNLQEKLPDVKHGGTPVQNSIPQPDVMKNNSLNQTLNKREIKKESNFNYEADDTNSNIQKGPSKSGYCYIGEDKGYRSCVYVKDSDTCMSGDIFPTNDICVNPNLRT